MAPLPNLRASLSYSVMSSQVQSCQDLAQPLHIYFLSIRTLSNASDGSEIPARSEAGRRRKSEVCNAAPFLVCPRVTVTPPPDTVTTGKSSSRAELPIQPAIYFPEEYWQVRQDLLASTHMVVVRKQQADSHLFWRQSSNTPWLPKS